MKRLIQSMYACSVRMLRRLLSRTWVGSRRESGECHPFHRDMRMRIVAATVFSGYILCASCVGAQAGDFTAFSLVGKWAVSAPMPNGGTLTTELMLTPNMKFSGSSSVDGRSFWTF